MMNFIFKTDLIPLGVILPLTYTVFNLWNLVFSLGPKFLNFIRIEFYSEYSKIILEFAIQLFKYFHKYAQLTFCSSIFQFSISILYSTSKSSDTQMHIAAYIIQISYVVDLYHLDTAKGTQQFCTSQRAPLKKKEPKAGRFYVLLY